jgi:hypothetical protein
LSILGAGLKCALEPLDEALVHLFEPLARPNALLLVTNFVRCGPYAVTVRRDGRSVDR